MASNNTCPVDWHDLDDITTPEGVLEQQEPYER